LTCPHFINNLIIINLIVSIIDDQLYRQMEGAQ